MRREMERHHPCETYRLALGTTRRLVLTSAHLSLPGFTQVRGCCETTHRNQLELDRTPASSSHPRPQAP